MSSLAPVPLVAGLVDDAAVFPPGLTPMRDAVPAHAEHRRAWYRELVGPFLVPVAQLGSFEDALGERAASAAPLRVSLVADRTAADPLPALLAAVHHLRRRSDTDVGAVEIAVGPGSGQPERALRLAASLVGVLPEGISGWVEVNRGDDVAEALWALAGSGPAVRAKFRTGGTEASAFPSADELAVVIRTAVDLSLPLKLTAGLHSALPGTDPVTGLPHHGFLAVLAAVAAAQDGAPTPAVAAVLRDADPAAVTRSIQALDDVACRTVRSVLCSFGCCGVTDPVDDLVRLGLLEGPAPGARDERLVTTRGEGAA